MRALSLLLLLSACDDAAPQTLELAAAIPDHAPLSGGTPIVLEGTGFAADGGHSPRVLIGGREAPLAYAIDDTTLGVIVPAGDAPGDAEIVVFDGGGSVAATGLFHYSSAPAITGITPAEVVATEDTRVTLMGSGFADEDAGPPVVLVDGVAAEDVEVIDDATLTFTAPAGVPFTYASLALENRRGAATARGYRTIPSRQPGLLLFGYYWEGTFATFVDPVARTAIPIPRIGSSTCVQASVPFGPQGLFVMDCNVGLGILDLATQSVVEAAFTGHYPYSMAEHRDVIYGIDIGSAYAFGRVDPVTREFSIIASFPCCDYAIASDGTTMWVIAREAGLTGIRTIDPDTGALGTHVPLVPQVPRIEDMRWYAGSLYATISDGRLVTIDPATGAITTILTGLPRSPGIEIFE